MRSLRSGYAADLRDSTSSLDDRVRFHFEHLQDYWGRCLGFVSQVRPELPVDSDLFACVAIGTTAAADEICEYCAREGADELVDAWRQHERQVQMLQRRSVAARADVERCAGIFDSLLDLYDPSIKVA